VEDNKEVEEAVVGWAAEVEAQEITVYARRVEPEFHIREAFPVTKGLALNAGLK
jgi:hypothetical protein